MGGRVFQRKTRARARARASGTRGGSGPPDSMLVLLRGRSGWIREVPDPYGGSGALAVSFGASLPQGHVASPDLSQAGNGSGAVGLVRKEPDPWGLAAPPSWRSYG